MREEFGWCRSSISKEEEEVLDTGEGEMEEAQEGEEAETEAEGNHTDILEMVLD